ncbi:MAG TPA: hypothetical protein VK509_03705, partial [Polyangiales bacterium]|nr:hypothetical protein [Polyangiales bacterium]
MKTNAGKKIAWDKQAAGLAAEPPLPDPIPASEVHYGYCTAGQGNGPRQVRWSTKGNEPEPCV